MRLVAGGFVGFLALVLVVSMTPVALGAEAPVPPGAAAPPRLVTDEIRLPAQAPVRPLPPATLLSLTFTLPYSNSGGLARWLGAVEDPTSTQYRHFLTEPEFVARFSPSPAQVASVAETLRSAGGTDLSVSGARNTVSAVLSAGAVESLLGVRLCTTGMDRGVPLYTAVGTVSLPPSLLGHVVGIGGLSDEGNPYLLIGAHHGPVGTRASGRSSSFVLSNTSGEWFVGSDFTQAYGASSLFPGGLFGSNDTFPSHVAVATLLASGYNESTNQNLPGWDPAVVRQYFNDTFPSTWPQPVAVGVPVAVDGIPAPPPASFGTLNDSSLDEYENSLDLEMAGSLAPGVALYNFYFAGSVLAGSTPAMNLADAFAADLSAALAENYSPARLGVVSGSFGLPDLNDSAWNSDLTIAASTGVTVVMASGDQGNAPDTLTGRGDGPWPVWPASVGFNTSGSVSVGGASVTLSGVPTTVWNGTSLNLSFDSNSTGFSGMSAWWDSGGCPHACAGTEGGLSSVYPEPYWEVHSAAQPPIAEAAGTQGVSSLGRAGPDLAFPANSTIAYVYADASENIYFTILEGTSVAAPVFAGLLADVIAVENRSGLPLGFGFVDPELYSMASYFAANPGQDSPFLDITSGSNYVFSAVAGWDAATGWGGLSAPRFLQADENVAVRAYHYAGPTPGLPATSNAPIPAVAIAVILGLGVVLAVLLVLVFVGPSRRRGPPPVAPDYGPLGTTYGVAPPVPPSAYGLPPPAPETLDPSPATYLCPFCGSIRPAEPVRCPRCGAL
ncbi:MAG: hypothetical protein L3K10_00840 [Thermoplasmata archaeon]|nr:hypothetical protein [Thermoplasmata archaeon]